MKEFIDKLIERLEEKIDLNERLLHRAKQTEFSNLIEKYKVLKDTYVEEIKIVNQLAEEYNGGWINADVESPTENGKYIVYYRKWTDGNYLPKFDETEIRILRYRNDGWIFPTYRDTEAEKDIHREVIAWQPLPNPFKPIAE